MGWKIWDKISDQKKQLLNYATLIREPFQIITITLLSLLLPLSFLLLARISTAHFLLIAFPSSTTTSPPHPYSLLFSLLLVTNPSLFHALVSLVSVAAFINGSTGWITLARESPHPVFLRPRLYTAWIFLFTLQFCVGLGIEGTIAAGIDGGFSFGHDDRIISGLSKLIFFLGLHETMLYWSRTIVKTVVDDTVFGFARDERWVERVAMVAGLGGLWWWRLRDEVESLVVVAEIKREMVVGVGVADFVGWWLYYLTVMIGMVRLVKGLIWLRTLIQKFRITSLQGNPAAALDSRPNDEKV